jgi:hypothetical protein
MDIPEIPEHTVKPKRGFEAFYKSIREKTDTSSIKGKVYVQFLVDTIGMVQCARVVKTDNALLNGWAIALIEETEFIPAEHRGKKLISTMTLPITFAQAISDRKFKP